MACSPLLTRNRSQWTSLAPRASRMILASAGLSSIRRIPGFLPPPSERTSLLLGRDGKEKCRTLSEFRGHPDSASGALHNSLANGKSHPGSWVLGGRVKAFKYSKDLLLVSRVDADSVILH